MFGDKTVDYDSATFNYVWNKDEDWTVREQNMFNMFVVANEHVSNNDLANKIDELAYWAADARDKHNALDYCRNLRRFVELLEYRIDNDVLDDSDESYDE